MIFTVDPLHVRTLCTNVCILHSARALLSFLFKIQFCTLCCPKKTLRSKRELDVEISILSRRLNVLDFISGLLHRRDEL